MMSINDYLEQIDIESGIILLDPTTERQEEAVGKITQYLKQICLMMGDTFCEWE